MFFDAVFVGHVVLFAVSTLACFASLPRALRIEHPGTREGFVGFLVSVGLWSAAYVGYLIAPIEVLQHGFFLAGYVFAFLAVVGFLYFAAAYTGRSPRQMPYRWASVAVVLAVVALKLTNPVHQLFFSVEAVVEPFPHLAVELHLSYWVILGMSYAAVAVGFFVIIERFYYCGSDTRPLVVLLAFTALPASATVLVDYFPTLLPLKYEPVGVAVFAVGVLFVYVQRFEAIQLAGDADAPACFLDRDGDIREVNQAARLLFPALEGSVGEGIGSVLPEVGDVMEEESKTVEFHEDGEPRYYRVGRRPFTTGGVTTGYLLTFDDVTEEERYRRKLEEKNHQLETLNRVVRHDIRNGMTVIQGWAEMLEGHVDEDGEEALHRVIRKSEDVINLTEIVRDLVESMAGGEEVELKEIELHPHPTREIEVARESHPHAVFDVDGEIPSVSVTANEMLQSVFNNLLNNAVRHNDEETPEVTISVVEEPDRVEVRFIDNGPGVPDSRKEAIFGKGEKGLDSPGSGVGLHLVHTLVRQFGGDVWVEDNVPKGAVFVVELPRAG